MLGTIFIVLLILWLLGFTLHFGGALDPLTLGGGAGGAGH